jgi:hypothetical protein
MCNCKKKKEEPVVPQTPEELHSIEITEWAGGMNVVVNLPEEEPTEE